MKAKSKTTTKAKPTKIVVNRPHAENEWDKAKRSRWCVHIRVCVVASV
jgi:hypothetical protein